jgi:glucan-binding YG repeat protein
MAKKYISYIRSLIAIFLLFLAVVKAIPAYAVTTQVAIELEAVDDGREYFQPGELIPYELTVKNKLGASWVRVKVNLSTNNIPAERFTDDNLHLLSTDWVKRGSYWYYTKKAEAYTDYPMIRGVQMPDIDRVNPDTDASVTISVMADAVQYDAFNPDFTKENPWDGAEIKHTTSVSGSSHSSYSSDSSSSGLYLYSSPQEKASVSSGVWVLISAEEHIWKYRDANGNYAKDGWIYVYNPYSKAEPYSWFHFDTDGIMTYGWYKATETVWYYTEELSNGDLGALRTGWHKDLQDKKWYYLDTKTGIMLSGWQTVNGKEYYLTEYNQMPEQTWFYRLLTGNSLGRWIYERLGYRSYGSLYVDETTPDGYKVDADGARIGGLDL